MKKLVFFILVLLLVRGVTFSAFGANGRLLQYENLLMGTEIGNTGNLNQVLAVLVGPQGRAGAAGVAGKSGFVGLNGAAGKDGIAGAPGPVGPSGAPGLQAPAGTAGRDGAQGPAGSAGRDGAQGAAGAPGSGGGGAIAIVSLASGDSNCPSGGTKFIAADGSQSFACNGSKGDISFSAGVGKINVCDDAIDVGMISHLDIDLGRFILDGIRVSDMNSKCKGARLDITLSTTTLGGTPKIFICTVLNLPDPLGRDLYLTGAGYNLKYGEVGLVEPLFCDPSLSEMDLTILDSILGFQLS